MPDTTLRVSPGSGLLSRRRDALLFTVAPEPELVAAFVAAPEDGELQALASATVAAGFEVGPFIGLSWSSGLRVMAFGDVAVETDQPSLPMLSGAGSRTWVEHTVPAGERAVVEVTATDAHDATDLVAGTVLAGGFRLEFGGTVAVPPEPETVGTTGDATTSVPRMEQPPVALATDVEPTSAPPQGPVDRPVVEREPEPEPEPDVAVDASAAATAEPAAGAQVPDVVDADADDPAAALAAIQAAAVGPDGQPFELHDSFEPTASHREPAIDINDPDVTLPPPASAALIADVSGGDLADNRGSLVDAKLCGSGHANPPTAATCAVCSEFLAPGATSVVHVPRPSLGRLQLDDGELIDLDQELLIGRNPDRDDDPDRAVLRRVKTIGDKVSRSHLAVRFQGWDVLVADCGSTNGTFVVPHPGGQVAALEPGRPQMIDAGAVVYFGSRSFTLLGREEVG